MTAFTKRGFTLIELLIVMAILGVLAVVVLVAINPVQQLARTRDAGRKSGVGQIGRSLEAYYTARGGSYITASTTWITELVTAGELSTVPAAVDNSLSPTCTTNVQNAWCYSTDSGLTAAAVYSALESDSETSKCDTGTIGWFVWDTSEGRGGLVCQTAEPTYGGQTWNSVQ